MVPREGKQAQSMTQSATEADSAGFFQLLTSFHQSTRGFTDASTDMSRRQFCLVRLRVKSCGERNHPY